MGLVQRVHSSRAMLATVATLVFVTSPAPVLAPPSMTMTTIQADTAQDEYIDRGYGGQIVAVDAAGIAMLIGGGVAESGEIAVAGLAVMAFGPGLVHASHGRGDAALASMVMRPAVTIAGMYIGAAMEDCSQGGDFCGLAGAFFGGLVAYGAVAVFDAAHLARERRTARPRSWTPQVSATSGGVNLGVAGAF